MDVGELHQLVFNIDVHAFENAGHIQSIHFLDLFLEEGGIFTLLQQQVGKYTEVPPATHLCRQAVPGDQSVK